jgi:hypothetical protein
MAFTDYSRSWYDIMAEEEKAQETRLLRMSAAEWKDEGRRMLRGWRGDIRLCVRYLDEVDRKRAAFAAPRPPVAPVARVPRSKFDIDFALWRDMVDEPAKYGDDIIEWLALDEALSKGEGRWRLGAYWHEKDAQEAEAEKARQANEVFQKRMEAATVIAAAVRGYQTRNSQPFLDCCMCLSHCISPLKTDVGMMCRACAEQGPYTDLVENDPWNWFRADYVDLAPSAVVMEYEPCRECTCPLEEGQTNGFCDRDCEYAFHKEEWRDRRY